MLRYHFRNKQRIFEVTNEQALKNQIFIHSSWKY